jgi:hypothetical protein
VTELNVGPVPTVDLLSMDVLHIVFSFLVYISQSSIFVENKHAPVTAIYF